MDYTRQFDSYQRVEIGKGEKTVAAYADDVRRFREWLDIHAVERGLAPAWEEVNTRHIRGYTAWLSAERIQTRKDGTRVTMQPVGGNTCGASPPRCGCGLTTCATLNRCSLTTRRGRSKRPSCPSVTPAR